VSYIYEYPRPAVAADIVAFTAGAYGIGVYVLLIERGHEPYKGMWALPGGHLDPGEDLVECAAREFHEEAGIHLAHDRLKQLGAYGKPGRDPRGDCVSIAFVTHLMPDETPKAGDDAVRAKWFPIDQLPPLAFDHRDVIADAVKQTLLDAAINEATEG
jgi:8-oxo-dGTP diphosphatase